MRESRLVSLLGPRISEGLVLADLTESVTEIVNPGEDAWRWEAQKRWGPHSVM